MAGNRILYTYALFFAFILFVLFDLYLFHLLFIFLLILPLVSLLAALPMRKNLRIRAVRSEDDYAKGVCGIRLSARNNSLFPCAGVRFTLERHNALGRVGDRYTESAEDIVQFPLGPMRAHVMQPRSRWRIAAGWTCSFGGCR
jgi:ABC-type transport system involved in cytochrome bd biosynthesis fused ATPase/permease subunit